MLRAVILFCAILVLAKGQTTDISQCTVYTPGWGQRHPVPLNTYIGGCTQQPCGLQQGRDAIVDIIFRAPRTMHRMTTAATAFMGLIPIPYPLGEDAFTCNFLSNTYCPVLEDEVVQYTLRMPIEEFMPVGTQVAIEFRIQDDNGTTFVCLRAQVHITAPSRKVEAQNATMTAEV